MSLRIARGFLQVLALCLAIPASAATISYSDSLPTAVTANPLTTSTVGMSVTLAENVTGTILNDRRSPWDAPNSMVSPIAANAVYSAVRNGGAIFDFGYDRGGLSLVWGTPGPLNVLELFLNGVSQLRLTGTDAVGPNGVAYSRFTEITDVRFDRVVFSAGNPAFEFANLSIASVPLPAGGLLLIGALGGLMVLRRRQAAV
jgi:hypothetical protein